MENNVIEVRVLTTADIAKVFIQHVDANKQMHADRSDYYEFARAIETEVLRKVQTK
jgi:hypothetical protein